MARRRSKAHRPASKPPLGGIGVCDRCGEPVGLHDFIVNAHRELLHDRHDDDCATQRHKERLGHGNE